MKKITISCSCGGSATVAVSPDDVTACTECACGKVLLWSRDGSTQARETQQITASDVGELPPLGISVGDDVKTKDKFGG